MELPIVNVWGKMRQNCSSMGKSICYILEAFSALSTTQHVTAKHQVCNWKYYYREVCKNMFEMGGGPSKRAK